MMNPTAEPPTQTPPAPPTTSEPPVTAPAPPPASPAAPTPPTQPATASGMNKKWIYIAVAVVVLAVVVFMLKG